MTHAGRPASAAPRRSLSAVVALLFAIPLLLAGAPGDEHGVDHGHEDSTGVADGTLEPGTTGGGPAAAVTAARGADKVGICHATGSDSRPYVFDSVARNSLEHHGHEGHAASPNKTWKRAGSWNGISHAAGEPKPDLIEFVPVTGDPLTRDYCTARGSDPVSGITLTKYVATGTLPTAACGESPWAASVDVTTGDPIHWCLRIENTGDDDLSQIAILDGPVAPPTGAAGCTLATTLAIDAVDECTYSTTAVVDGLTNHASVSARGDDSKDRIADTASAAYTATDPAPPESGIALDTYVATGTPAPGAACGQAPWAASVTVAPGDPIHWCHRVENTGDDALSTVALLDAIDLAPPTTAGCGLATELAVLAVGECAYTGTASLGTHTLHASVSAVGDDSSDTVGDTGSAFYEAVAARIVRDIDPPVVGGIDPPVAGGIDPPATTTRVPGITVDTSADGTAYRVGETITYTYVITNSGETTLTALTVTDDVLGDLTDLLVTGSLEPGDVTTVTTTQVVLAEHVGELTNVVVVTGRSPGGEVSATDAVTVAVTDVLGVVIDNPALMAPAPAPRPQPQPQPAPSAPAPAPAAPEAPVAATELPRTGSDPLPAGLLAAGLVLAGSLLLRRTRTT